MSNALHAIIHHNKNDDNGWLSCNRTYITQRDVQRNKMFTYIHSVITCDEYLI